MMFSVEISTKAKEDIRAIFEYIAYDLQSFETAVRQLERFENSITSLREMPERFRVYEKEPWKSRGIRIMRVNHYLVFYIPENESKIVKIMRVIYSGRNIEAQLNDD